MIEENTNTNTIPTPTDITPALSGKKILIVEDDRFLHSLLSDKLKKSGVQVISAFDVETGLEEAAKSSPDLILLDIILPGVDGFSVLEKLKADDSLKKIPVIILSNLGQEEEIKRGTELGAVEFLIKANFTLDEIIEKLSSVLSKT